MTAIDRLEFNVIRDEQTRLRHSVERLDHRLDQFERRVESSAVSRSEPPRASEPPPLPVAAAIQPPSVPPKVESTVTGGETRSPAPESVALAEVSPPIEEPSAGRVEAHASVPELPFEHTETRPSAPTNAEPLELRVGTYWMARIGIVILLTGLVFLGNYAYHRIIPYLGPWGKLSLITLAGLSLGGLGAWLERTRESMRNYGRVLLAGGAATIYYATYAAHFVEALRVIESPILGGGLLLALAGGFLWHAERRRSEAVALPSVLLAYYTSAINSIGGFTLFSNLLLTAAAVFFLVRHRWTRMTYASLAATYGSYAFWRFHQVIQSGGPGSEFGMGVTFLAGYWVLFTAAVFLSSREVMRGSERIAFLTANNAAFFAFAAHHFAMHRPDAFWMFALGYGVVLLALAALAARLRTEDRVLDGAYLAQGLGMFTIGVASKLTGPRLAVVMVVESTALIACARRRHGLIYELAAGLCALWACGLTIMELSHPGGSPVALGGPVAALLFFNAWWIKFQRGEWNSEKSSERAFAFAALGLLVVGAVLWRKVDAPWQPAAFALASAAGLAALRARLREIALPAQGFLFLGVAILILRTAEAIPAPWWSPLPLLITALGLMHWWQRQQAVKLDAVARSFLELSFAGAAVITGLVWMNAFCHGGTWLWATSAAALGTLLYGWLTKAWPLAVVGQICSAIASFSFASALIQGHPAWHAALAPVLNLALTSLLLSRSPQTLEGWNLRSLAQAYRIGAMLLLSAWAFEYVDASGRVAFFAGLGALQMFLGAWSRNHERTISGAIYATAGLALFWTQLGATNSALDLLAILAVPASLRLGRWITGENPLSSEARNALVAAAMASVWLWVTRWVNLHDYSDHLTAAWAALALIIFAAGLGLRERIYRLGGFGVLGLAMGRLFVMDVWKFDTLHRILSFLALGVVLLVLSFIYNRFAETMRRWL